MPGSVAALPCEKLIDRCAAPLQRACPSTRSSMRTIFLIAMMNAAMCRAPPRASATRFRHGEPAPASHPQEEAFRCNVKINADKSILYGGSPRIKAANAYVIDISI